MFIYPKILTKTYAGRDDNIVDKLYNVDQYLAIDVYVILKATSRITSRKHKRHLKKRVPCFI